MNDKSTTISGQRSSWKDDGHHPTKSAARESLAMLTSSTLHKEKGLLGYINVWLLRIGAAERGFNNQDQSCRPYLATYDVGPISVTTSHSHTGGRQAFRLHKPELPVQLIGPPIREQYYSATFWNILIHPVFQLFHDHFP